MVCDEWISVLEIFEHENLSVEIIPRIEYIYCYGDVLHSTISARTMKRIIGFVIFPIIMVTVIEW